jgi:hypothetical protein
MRCLYCGIRLKIAKKAKVIQHCPECSMRMEDEGRLNLRRTEDRNRSLQAKDGRPMAAFAATRNA